MRGLYFSQDSLGRIARRRWFSPPGVLAFTKPGCLRESRARWRCIPQQLVVFPLRTWTVCLICLPAYFASSCGSLCFLQTRGLDTHTHTQAGRGWTASKSKLAELIQRKQFNICGYTQSANTHGGVLQIGWFLFLLEYIWCSRQLRETYMQSAPATVRLKHAQWIKSKTEQKQTNKREISTPPAPTPPSSVHLVSISRRDPPSSDFFAHVWRLLLHTGWTLTLSDKKRKKKEEETFDCTGLKFVCCLFFFLSVHICVERADIHLHLLFIF